MQRSWESGTGGPGSEVEMIGGGFMSRPVAYPGIFFGGVQQIQLRTEERENREGSGGGSPLVRGSGGSCNLVQEISFHIVNFSQFLVL